MLKFIGRVNRSGPDDPRRREGRCGAARHRARAARGLPRRATGSRPALPGAGARAARSDGPPTTCRSRWCSRAARSTARPARNCWRRCAPCIPTPSARCSSSGALGRPRRPARRSSTSMARGRIDHYVVRPSAPPDELFHQAISGSCSSGRRRGAPSPYTIHVVGESWSGRAYELREVLGRCAIPHAFCLADSDEGRALVAGRAPGEAPARRLPRRHGPGGPQQRRDRAGVGLDGRPGADASSTS